MKRAHLIEWGIIVIALIFGYKFIESILTVLMQLIFMWGSEDQLTKIILRYLLVIGLYFGAFILLVSNSGKIAVYFSREDVSDNSMDIKIGKRSLLQVILIAICISAVIFNIADIIYYLFDSFRSEVRVRDLFETEPKYKPDKTRFIVSIMEMVLAIIVIYFSRDISSLLVRKNEADELVFDSKPKV